MREILSNTALAKFELHQRGAWSVMVADAATKQQAKLAHGLLTDYLAGRYTDADLTAIERACAVMCQCVMNLREAVELAQRVRA